jgi:hypothetical protein
VRPLGATETKFPEWFPSLVNRIRKEGDMKPIYRTEKIPITEKEFNEAIKKMKKLKVKNFMQILEQKNILDKTQMNFLILRLKKQKILLDMNIPIKIYQMQK